MNQRAGPRKEEEHLLGAVEQRALRRLRARHGERHALWFGLGMFGLVGWSIVLPVLMGIAAGVWIDARFPSRFSWTLMLLVLGLMIGCWNAWHWIERERKRIHRISNGTEGQ